MVVGVSSLPLKICLVCEGPFGRGESLIKHEQHNEDGLDASPCSGNVHPHIRRGGGDGIGSGYITAAQISGHARV